MAGSPRADRRAVERRLMPGWFAPVLAVYILSTVAAAWQADRTPLEERS
jgi:hypothetical protein